MVGTVVFMVVVVVVGFVVAVVLSELNMASRLLLRQLVVLQQLTEQLLRVPFSQGTPHEALQLTE